MCAQMGMGELMIILVIVVVVFGAGKLPQIGDALGRSVKNFKKAVAGNDEIDVTPKKEIGARPSVEELSAHRGGLNERQYDEMMKAAEDKVRRDLAEQAAKKSS